MSTPTAIALLADGRHVCPRCSGGLEQEQSLSVRRDESGGVHWRCFRSSCGYTGGPRETRSVFSGIKKEARHFTRPIKPLTPEQYELLSKKYGFAPDVDGYSYWDDRFILPVFGPSGYNKRGVVAYSFNTKPKSLTYNEKPAEPFIHWAPPGAKTYHIVVVEDWFSAEKVALTFAAEGVALMGTHLSQEMVTELATQAAALDASVHLALDRDAFAKTVGYIAKYREQFPRGLYAWSLKQDLKYETTERIKRALDGANDFIGNVEQPEHA